MNLIDQLRRDEGVRRTPYTDTKGILTIGVGRNLMDKGLSDQEVDVLLANDIQQVQTALYPYGWYARLDPVRQAALQNMAFNLGVNGLLHFPAMIAALDRGDYAQAAVEALDSDWANQVGARAVRIAQQLKSGEWV